MNYANTIKQLEYLEEVNQWITTTLNIKNNQSRFTKYKKYLNEKYIKENFESYYNLLKLRFEYVSFKNDYINAINKNDSIEFELSKQLEKLIDSFENYIKCNSQNSYYSNLHKYLSFFNAYEHSYNGNIRFLNKQLVELQNKFIIYNSQNNQIILEESFKYTLQISEVLKECFDISIIYHVFKKEKGKGFIDKLSKIKNGIELVEYNKNADDRNFLFELVISAYFKTFNWKIDFSTKTDVIAIKDNITIFSECKKITSKKNFEKEMKKALKQLEENHIENNNNFNGMIFIDITNVIFEDLKNYLYENKFIIKNQFEGIELLQKLIFEFLSLKSKIIDDLNDKNVDISLGTVFYASIPLLINNEIIFFTTKLDIRASQHLNDEKFENLKEIISPFEKAFEPMLSNFKSF